MFAINNVTIGGYVAKDPESTTTSTGKTVVKFPVALNEQRGQYKSTEYIDVELWENNAKYANSYVKKGSIVTVTGKIKTNSWKTKEGKNAKRVFILGLLINVINLSKSEAASCEAPDDENYCEE